MPKKSFKDNPALQFLTVTRDPAAQEADPAPDTQSAPWTPHAEAAPAAPHAPAPERKTRRLNLLIRPSLLADIDKIAHMRRVSVNELVNAALEAYRDAHADRIQAYDDVFGP